MFKLTNSMELPPPPRPTDFLQFLVKDTEKRTSELHPDNLMEDMKLFSNSCWSNKLYIYAYFHM